MTDLKSEMLDAIDTDGVTVEDIKKQPIEDRPVFSIPMAMQWARDPKNAPKIEQFAKDARVAQDKFMHRLDDGVTEVKDVIVDILMNEETESDIVSELLGHFTGIK